MSDNIVVALRVRPLISREVQDSVKLYWKVENNYITQIDPDTKKSIGSSEFDKVFDSHISNHEIYEEVAFPIVQSALTGINGTIFAYGQTSSGKTFTMTGNKVTPGIIPLSIQDIFQSIENTPDREFLLRASYMEIYQENICDLLTGVKIPTLREDSSGSITVPGLKEVCVTNEKMLLSVMADGDKRRKVAETSMNERSSRSHSIFRLIVESRETSDKECDGAITVSHLNLVDLAGSENASQTGATGERLKEGGSINKSLFMLGRVISQLSDEESYINFRDSKLTRILQTSLGGNAKTAMLCTITPANREQALSTIRFASRAKSIKNKPIVNEVLSEAALLKRYAVEINKLKSALENERNTDKAQEVEQVKEKLDEQEKRNLELQEKLKSLKEKLVVSSLSKVNPSFKDKKSRRETWAAPAIQRLSRRSEYNPKNSAFLHPAWGLQKPSPILEEETLDLSFSNIQSSCPENELSCVSIASFHSPAESVFQRGEISRLEGLDCSFLSPEMMPKRGKLRKCVNFAESTYPLFSNLKDAECQTESSLIPKSLSVQLLTPKRNGPPEMFMTTPPGVTPREVLRAKNREISCSLKEKEAWLKAWQREYDELNDYQKKEITLLNESFQRKVGDWPTDDKVKDLQSEIKSLKHSLSDSEKMYLHVNKSNSEQAQELTILKEQVKELLEERSKYLKSSEEALMFSESNKTLKKSLEEKERNVVTLQQDKLDFDIMLELALQKQKQVETDLRRCLDDAWAEIANFNGSSKVEVQMRHERMMALETDVSTLQEAVINFKREELTLVEEVKSLKSQLHNCKEELTTKDDKNEELCSELKNMRQKVKDMDKRRLISEDSEDYYSPLWTTAKEKSIFEMSTFSIYPSEMSRKLSETINVLEESLLGTNSNAPLDQSELRVIKEQLLKLQEALNVQEQFQLTQTVLLDEDKSKFNSSNESFIYQQILHDYMLSVTTINLLDGINLDYYENYLTMDKKDSILNKSDPEIEKALKLGLTKIQESFNESKNFMNDMDFKSFIDEESLFMNEDLMQANNRSQFMSLADELKMANDNSTFNESSYNEKTFINISKSDLIMEIDQLKKNEEKYKTEVIALEEKIFFLESSIKVINVEPTKGGHSNLNGNEISSSVVNIANLEALEIKLPELENMKNKNVINSFHMVAEVENDLITSIEHKVEILSDEVVDRDHGKLLQSEILSVISEEEMQTIEGNKKLKNMPRPNQVSKSCVKGENFSKIRELEMLIAKKDCEIITLKNSIKLQSESNGTEKDLQKYRHRSFISGSYETERETDPSKSIKISEQITDEDCHIFNQEVLSNSNFQFSEEVFPEKEIKVNVLKMTRSHNHTGSESEYIRLQDEINKQKTIIEDLENQLRVTSIINSFDKSIQTIDEFSHDRPISSKLILNKPEQHSELESSVLSFNETDICDINELEADLIENDSILCVANKECEANKLCDNYSTIDELENFTDEEYTAKSHFLCKDKIEKEDKKDSFLVNKSFTDVTHETNFETKNYLDQKEKEIIELKRTLTEYQIKDSELDKFKLAVEEQKSTIEDLKTELEEWKCKEDELESMITDFTLKEAELEEKESALIEKEALLAEDVNENKIKIRNLESEIIEKDKCIKELKDILKFQQDDCFEKLVCLQKQEVDIQAVGLQVSVTKNKSNDEDLVKKIRNFKVNFENTFQQSENHKTNESCGKQFESKTEIMRLETADVQLLNEKLINSNNLVETLQFKLKDLESQLNDNKNKFKLKEEESCEKEFECKVELMRLEIISLNELLQKQTDIAQSHAENLISSNNLVETLKTKLIELEQQLNDKELELSAKYNLQEDIELKVKESCEKQFESKIELMKLEIISIRDLLQKENDNCQSYDEKLVDRNSFVETLQTKLVDLEHQLNDKEIQLSTKYNLKEGIELKVKESCEKQFESKIELLKLEIVSLRDLLQKETDNCQSYNKKFIDSNSLVETLQTKLVDLEHQLNDKDIEFSTKYNLQEDIELKVKESCEKQFESKIELLKVEIESLRDLLQKETDNCQSYKEKFVDSNSLVETLQTKLVELEQQLNDKEIEHSTKYNPQEDILTVKESCEKEFESKIELLKFEIASLHGLLQKETDNCQSYNEKLIDSNSLVETLQTKLVYFERQLNDKEIELSTMCNLQKDIELKVKESCEKEFESKIELLKGEIESLRDLLQKETDNCQSYNEKLIDSNSLVGTLQTKLVDLEHQLNDKNIELSTKYNLQEDIESKVKESCEKQFESKIELLKVEIESLRDLLQKETDNCQSYKEKFVDSNSLVETLQTKLVELEQQLNDKEIEHSTKYNPQEDILTVKESYDKEFESKIELLKLEIVSLQDLLLKETDNCQSYNEKLIDSNSLVETLQTKLVDLEHQLNDKDIELSTKYDLPEDIELKVKESCEKEFESKIELLKVEIESLRNLLQKETDNCQSYNEKFVDSNNLVETLQTKLVDLEHQLNDKEIELSAKYNLQEDIITVRENCEKEFESKVELMKLEIASLSELLEKETATVKSHAEKLLNKNSLVKTLQAKVVDLERLLNEKVLDLSTNYHLQEDIELKVKDNVRLQQLCDNLESALNSRKMEIDELKLNSEKQAESLLSSLKMEEEKVSKLTECIKNKEEKLFKTENMLKFVENMNNPLQLKIKDLEDALKEHSITIEIILKEKIELESCIDSLKIELSSIKSSHVTLCSERDNLSKEIISRQEEIEELFNICNSLKNDKELLETEAATLLENFESSQVDLQNKINLISSLNDQILDLKVEIKSINEEHSKCGTEVEKLISFIEKYELEATDKESHIEKLTNENKKMQLELAHKESCFLKENQECMDIIKTHEDKEKALKNDIEVANTRIGEITLKLQDRETNVNELSSHIQKLQDEIKSILFKNSELSNLLKTTQAELQDKLKRESDIEKLATENKKIKSELDSYTQIIKSLEDKEKVCKKQVDELHFKEQETAHELHIAKNNVAELSNHNKNLLEEVQLFVQENKKLSELLEATKSELKEKINECKALDKELDETVNEYKSNRADVNKMYSEMNEKIHELEKEKSMLSETLSSQSNHNITNFSGHQKLDDLAALSQKYNSPNAENELLKKSIASLKKEKDSRVSELLTEINILRNGTTSSTKEVTQLRLRVLELENEIKNFSSAGIQQLELISNSEDSEIFLLKRKYFELNNKYKDLLLRYAVFDGMEACQLEEMNLFYTTKINQNSLSCNDDMKKEFEERICELEKENNRLTQLLEVTKSELKQKIEECNSLDKELDETVKEYKSNRADLNTMYSEMNEKIHELEKEKSMLSDTLTSQTNQNLTNVTDSQKGDDLLLWSKKYDSLNAENKRLMMSIENLKRDNDSRISELLTEINTLRNGTLSSTDEVAPLRSRVLELENEIKNFNSSGVQAQRFELVNNSENSQGNPLERKFLELNNKYEALLQRYTMFESLETCQLEEMHLQYNKEARKTKSNDENRAACNGSETSDDLKKRYFELERENNVLKMKLAALNAPAEKQVKNLKEQLEAQTYKNRNLMSELRRLQKMQVADISICDMKPKRIEKEVPSKFNTESSEAPDNLSCGSKIILDVKVMRLENENYHLEKEKKSLMQENKVLNEHVEHYKGKASEWKKKCCKEVLALKEKELQCQSLVNKLDAFYASKKKSYQTSPEEVNKPLTTNLASTRELLPLSSPQKSPPLQPLPTNKDKMVLPSLDDKAIEAKVRKTEVKEKDLRKTEEKENARHFLRSSERKLDSQKDEDCKTQ